jgi:hypothetical protein
VDRCTANPALLMAFERLTKKMPKTRAIIHTARKLLNRIRYVLKKRSVCQQLYNNLLDCAWAVDLYDLIHIVGNAFFLPAAGYNVSAYFRLHTNTLKHDQGNAVAFKIQACLLIKGGFKDLLVLK